MKRFAVVVDHPHHEMSHGFVIPAVDSGKAKEEGVRRAMEAEAGYSRIVDPEDVTQYAMAAEIRT